MSKTSIDLTRHALNGPTMGSRWSALFFTDGSFDHTPVRVALQAAVDEVDRQMSTWKPDSDLSRLNAAPVGDWVPLPARLLEVLDIGLGIGRASGGAFDIGMGDAVSAWGFGTARADPARIQAAMAASRRPAHDILVLDVPGGRALKLAPLSVDLNGIAKGYGVDRLAETLGAFGIASGLVGIDGEMRATGLRPDGTPWVVAVEAPEPHRRAPHSILALQDAAVATSGDYRHWIEVRGRRLSHTMDPRRGAPLTEAPASVTVVARRCVHADAWATAFMVLGTDAGVERARQIGLDALFLVRDDQGGVCSVATGLLFSGRLAAIAPAGGNEPHGICAPTA